MPKSKFFIADCHLHGPSPSGTMIWQWFSCTRTYREYLDFLIDAGTGLGVLNSDAAVQARTPWQLRIGNRYSLKLVRDGSSRRLKLIPACIVHPDCMRQSAEDLRMFKDNGSTWAGEMCPYVTGHDTYHPNYLKMAEMVEEAGFVFQIHQQPAKALARIARHCPTMPLVVSHFGKDRKSVADKFRLAPRQKNIYLDISAGNYDRMGVLERAVEVGLEDRVLYGSDFPINDPNCPIARIMHSRLTAAVKRKILSGNLLRLLKERGTEIP